MGGMRKNGLPLLHAWARGSIVSMTPSSWIFLSVLTPILGIACSGNVAVQATGGSCGQSAGNGAPTGGAGGGSSRCPTIIDPNEGDPCDVPLPRLYILRHQLLADHDVCKRIVDRRGHRLRVALLLSVVGNPFSGARVSVVEEAGGHERGIFTAPSNLASQTSAANAPLRFADRARAPCTTARRLCTVIQRSRSRNDGCAPRAGRPRCVAETRPPTTARCAANVRARRAPLENTASP